MSSPEVKDKLAPYIKQLDQLDQFLKVAPQHWVDNLFLRRLTLPGSEEHISCIYWAGHHYVTGTDIIRALRFRCRLRGYLVVKSKKYEEGVFSDLRHLRPGKESRLEAPRSELLDLLFRFNCVRTKKKQKLFQWKAVRWDRLFDDALRRDQRREVAHEEMTTV
ncbi:MAG: STE like transcription factor-domain-containing protein, partial [Piptocephalis tieghemiana]